MKKYLSHYRALVMLGTPLIIGQIGVVLQNFADTLMIGHHTTVELAAASLVSNIFILGLLMAMGFALCMTPLIGKAYGQGDVDSIGSTVKNGLAVNTLAALVLMAVYTVLYFFLDKLGQPGELLPYVRPYYLINLVSIPFVCWVNGLLIYGHWGLPELGITGAGLSTLAARVLMFVAIALCFAFSGRHRGERAAFRKSRVSRGEMRSLIVLGTPISLQMGMESGAWSLCSIIVGWIGTNALAGHQIMLTISQLFFQFYYALASAVSIRVSHFHGQHDYTAIRRTAWAGCHLNFMIAILVSVPVILFRGQMGFLFTSSPKVAAEVASAIVPLIIYQFSDGLQCTFSNAMRGLAYVKPVMLVAFLSYFVVSLPLAYFFGISLQGGLVGVWFSFPFGLTVAGALYYHYYHRRLLSLEETTQHL